MTVCQKIRGYRRKVCLGDLDRQIEIYERDIQSPTDQNFMMHEQEYSLKAKPWAMINTLRGVTTFDDIEISGINALEIFIRHNPLITTEDFVRIDGKNIQITSIEDLDRRKEFMRLICIDRGDADKQASL